MGYYVIAVGGTGNKILESVVYAACADAFYTVDERGRRIPIPRIHMLSVDVDAACGNTTRAKRAAEYYEAVREAFTASPVRHRGFHTALSVERWGMNLSKRAASVNQMVKNHARDQLLSRTLFSKTEASLEYSEGFRGHPDLGVLFFADLLGSLEARRSQALPDELLAFIDRMQQDIDRGEAVRLILCGSIFGGTGASGIPALSKYLRRYFSADADLFQMASMLMLPYYKVPASSHNEELEIVVKSSTFLDKARTALQYYGMESMIRDGESDETGIFDAIYLLGLPPESFVTARVYSTGSQSQENDAHMMEWLASRCVARFFRTGFRGADAHNIDCYYYQWHTPVFCWQSFDSEADLYRFGYGTLLKAASVFFSECYPTLRAQVSGARGRYGRVNYCAPYFHQVKRYSTAQRAKLEKRLDALYHFFAFYANWFIQVVRTLPPTMRQRRSAEAEAALAAQNYDRLTGRAVFLAARPQAETFTRAERNELERLRGEYDAMQSEQGALIRRIGGSAWLEVLKNAQLAARERLFRQRSDVAELAEQIALWHGEDSALIDPQTLRQEEERLAAMRRAQADMESRLTIIGADIEDAIRQNVVESIPAPPAAEAGEPPRNELVDSGLLTALETLLREYGGSPAQRDTALFEQARLRLQKGLQNLIVHRVPDRRDMARVISGLGGGECDAKRPDAALAGFLTALLQAVTEEETL